MARRPEPAKRDRIVHTTRESIRRRGVAGTTMLDVVAEAGASRGSLYHYFPGGRSEMVTDAVREAVAEYTDALAALVDLPPPTRSPSSSRCGASRPRRAATPPAARWSPPPWAGRASRRPVSLAGRAFTDWSAAVAAWLAHQGVPEERTASLANLLLSAVEGAVVIGLAQHRSEPMLRVAEEPGQAGGVGATYSARCCPVSVRSP
ncbi:TetR/AcrR family transcriptional regulator [Nocardioides sp. W3-2-3]|nr:TetR/AcrR family transcriptional regulator [Nocardioides convexus]